MAGAGHVGGSSPLIGPGLDLLAELADEHRAHHVAHPLAVLRQHDRHQLSGGPAFSNDNQHSVILHNYLNKG